MKVLDLMNKEENWEEMSEVRRQKCRSIFDFFNFLI